MKRYLTQISFIGLLVFSPGCVNNKEENKNDSNKDTVIVEKAIPAEKDIARLYKLKCASCHTTSIITEKYNLQTDSITFIRDYKAVATHDSLADISNIELVQIKDFFTKPIE